MSGKTTRTEVKACDHSGGTTTHHDHVACSKCEWIKTDSGWGADSNRWFPSLDVARRKRAADHGAGGE